MTALGSYTWSHCIDYSSSNFFVAFERGNCDMDIRHNFTAVFSYGLPKVGRGGVVGALLNNWGIDDRFVARTGFPVTLGGTESLLQNFDPDRPYQSNHNTKMNAIFYLLGSPAFVISELRLATRTECQLPLSRSRAQTSGCAATRFYTMESKELRRSRNGERHHG